MTETYVFDVTGMHCASCSLLIDDTLEDLPGVSSTHTVVKTGECTVQLDATLTGPQTIIDAITDLGYTVTGQH
ncbi:heavy metal-associated domain-containing protein [Mycobacterium sp. OTB74]|jgi:copper chaperone CopZ|uniref:heavy-metal-associated domain-containing protein n=1 Tax=Mycobacterium sp. OTB74 TaxID=1853452 RepID=UPI002476FE17|nr:heavy metal-associated domain-containing protein [Mycobacterium sp. OTB74]MDH6244029.1 copper chaperone [Mycobacterium sp. OTB74]